MLREKTASYTEEQKRLANYIKESFKGKGLSDEAAELIAWATVNKESRINKKETQGLKEK